MLGSGLSGTASAAVPNDPARGVLGWNNVDARFGGRRRYFQWQHLSTLAATTRAIADSGDLPLVSLKPPLPIIDGLRQIASGQHDNTLRNALASLPVCYFCPLHEPEDDVPTASATFRAAFDRVSTLLPSHVTPTVCLMDWTFDSRSGRNPKDWLPASAKLIAVDPYNWFGIRYSSWITPTTLMRPIMDWCVRFNEQRPLAVWETNTLEDPAQPNRKADWIREFANLAERYKLRQLTFFNSVTTEATAFKLFTSPAADAAVTEIANRPYFQR